MSESAGDNDNKTVSTGNTGQESIVLEEEIDPNYVPTESEVIEYAKWLGMDLEKDKDLFWVAKEGLMAPLPKNWKPCKTKETEDIYYFNFATGESTWDHPCDGYYKRLFEEAKKKKETAMKESSDQNRSQAKADVEKLLGKVEKKKKRKTDADTLSIGTLGRKSEGSSSEIGRNALSKAPLGPIGKLTVLDKKALPGIGGIPGPKRSLSPPKSINADNPMRKSEVSVLTSSFDSSDSGKDRVLDGPKRSLEPETRKSLPETDTAFSSSTGTGQRKSKMSSRLAAVVSDSGENQLPSPTKGSTMQKTGSLPLPSYTESEAKQQSEGSSKSPVRSSQEKGVERERRDRERASATENADREREAKVASAKENADLAEYKARTTEELSALSSALRRTEEALHKKKRQCDRLSDEVADIELRLSREKQNQSMAEQTESALLRQARDAKDKLGSVQAENEKLQKENDDFRIRMKELDVQKSEEEGSDKDSDEKTIASLRGQIEVHEASIQRASEAQQSIREELANQTKFYDAKVQAASKATADANEDLTRLQKKLEQGEADANNTRARDKEEMSKLLEDSQKNVLVLKKQLDEAKKASATMHASMTESKQLEIANLQAELASAKSEVSGQKDRVEDLTSSNKRLQQLVASWEADCHDRDKRLTDSRTKVNELEGKVDQLEKDKKETASGGAATAVERSAQNAELEKKVTTLTDESLKARKEKMELERQVSDLEEDKLNLSKGLSDAQSTVAMLSKSSPQSGEMDESRTKEFIDAKAQIIDLESTVRKLTEEKKRVAQDATLAKEQLAISEAEVAANKDMLARLQSTRDTGADMVKQDMQKHIGVLEGELNTALNDASEAKSKRDLLQIKYDAVMRDSKAAGAQSTKLTTELTGLNRELSDKDHHISELQMSLREIRASEENYKRSATTLEHETSSHRSTIASLQTQVDQLSRQRDMVPPAPVSAPVAAHVPPPGGAAGPGMLELGVLMGQQQATAAALETRLREADELIGRMHERNSTTATQQPAVRAAPSSGDGSDPAGENPNDSDIEGYSKSELLREVLLDYVKKRKPMLQDESSPEHLSSENWKALLAREMKFTTEARRALKDEKAAIKWEQQLLLNRRDVWKQQRHTRSSSAMLLLNQQTTQLNEAVERARRTGTWLTEREQKLASFHKLLRASVGDQRLFLDLELLAKELDNDTMQINFTNPFTVGPLNVEALEQPQVSMASQNTARGTTNPAFSYFPESVHASKYSNTYLTAQENKRPTNHGQAPDNISVVRLMEQPSKNRTMTGLHRERAEGEVAYGSTATWLESIRSQIDGFNVGGSARLAEKNENRYQTADAGVYDL